MGIVSSIASVHKIPGDLAKSAVRAVKSSGTALQTLSQLAQNMGGEKTQKLVRSERFVEVGCYETVQTLRPYPKFNSLLLTQYRGKTFEALLKTLNVEPKTLEMEPGRRVEVGCYMTVHTLSDLSAQRVVDALFESQARRMASPSLITMILKRPDIIARGNTVEVGCYVSVRQAFSDLPVIKDLRKIEYAFSPIASVLSYVGKPALNFLGFN